MEWHLFHGSNLIIYFKSEYLTFGGIVRANYISESLSSAGELMKLVNSRNRAHAEGFFCRQECSAARERVESSVKRIRKFYCRNTLARRASAAKLGRDQCTWSVYRMCLGVNDRSEESG